MKKIESLGATTALRFPVQRQKGSPEARTVQSPDLGAVEEPPVWPGGHKRTIKMG